LKNQGDVPGHPSARQSAVTGVPLKTTRTTAASGAEDKILEKVTIQMHVLVRCFVALNYHEQNYNF
jgi:hypothetical protein